MASIAGNLGYAFVEYNPMELIRKGISYLSQPAHKDTRIFTIFISTLFSLAMYFARKFGEISAMPLIMSALSPIECAVATFAVLITVWIIAFGCFGKNQNLPPTPKA